MVRTEPEYLKMKQEIVDITREALECPEHGRDDAFQYEGRWISDRLHFY